MKLLIITRKVDSHDERMSFFSDWLLEFAKNTEKLLVICQEKGETAGLPGNVEIYSLGKEKGFNKLKQLLFLYFYIFKFLKCVDGVFSHMMPVYAILVGPWCKIYGKKLVQWYTHRSVDWRLRLAALFVDEFVTASHESFRLKTNKPVRVLGHGINTKRFAPITDNKQQITNNNAARPSLNLKEGENCKFIILSVGRISPVKNIDLLVKAVEKILLDVPEMRDKISLQIIGGPGLVSQAGYYNDLIKEVHEKKLDAVIDFLGPLPQTETIKYYQECDLFVNLSETGSIDKVVLEAMACGSLVLTSNEAFKAIVPSFLFLVKNDVDFLIKRIKDVYYLPNHEKEHLKKHLRREVLDKHNLEKLIEKIIHCYLLGKR